MYLVNTWPYLCFAVNTLSEFMVDPSLCALGRCKTCVALYFRDNRFWFGLQEVIGDQIGWLYRFRLGRQCGRPKEHFRMLFQFGLNSSVVVQSEAKVRCIEYCRRRVHGSQFGQLRGLVASQVASESIWPGA